MIKKIFFIFGLILISAVCVNSQAVSLDEFMAKHKDEILKINRDEAMRNYISTHLLSNYGDVANVVGFTDALTSGVYLKEIDYILKEKILEVRIDARSLKSVDKLKVHVARIKQARPLTVNINEGMTKIGYYVTAATIATQVYGAFHGDDAAKREAVASAFSAEMSWLINKIGSTALSASMAGVQFIDYSLKKFIKAQYDQYNEFWWNAYSSYLNKNYPSLVSGSGSWAALVEAAGSDGLQNRLNEFWQNPLENAAVYYRVPSPFQRDALSSAEFKNSFSARYYNDYLKTTLTTYFSRKAEEDAAARLREAQKEFLKTAEFIEEMISLKKIIEEVKEEIEKDKPPLPKMEIFRVTLGGYTGEPFVPPAQAGDDLHFSARVVFPEGEPYKGILSWNLENESGEKMTIGTSREVYEAAGAKGYGYKPNIKTITDGRYRVVLTFHPADDIEHYASAVYPIEFLQKVKVDKIIASGGAENFTHQNSFSPDDEIFFHAYYTLSGGAKEAKVEFAVKNLNSGAVINKFEGNAVSDAQKEKQFLSSISVPARSFKAEEEGSFEAAVILPDGKKDIMEIKFKINPYKLSLILPSELRPGKSGDFSIGVPESFKAPYTVDIKPSRGLASGHTPGSLKGTVSAIIASASTEKLTVKVTDAENKTAEASGTVKITLPYSPALITSPAPAASLNISGVWRIRTVSERGYVTDYSMTISGAGSSYTGTIRRLGKNPYSWPANVSLNQSTREVVYKIVLGTKPPIIPLVHIGKIDSGGRTANGTFYREGGRGTAWSGRWTAHKE